MNLGMQSVGVDTRYGGGEGNLQPVGMWPLPTGPAVALTHTRRYAQEILWVSDRVEEVLELKGQGPPLSLQAWQELHTRLLAILRDARLYRGVQILYWTVARCAVHGMTQAKSEQEADTWLKLALTPWKKGARPFEFTHNDQDNFRALLLEFVRVAQQFQSEYFLTEIADVRHPNDPDARRWMVAGNKNW